MQTIDLLTPHPDLTGYTRKAVVKSTIIDHENKFSILAVDIQHYLNGELVNNPTGLVRNIRKELRADNTVFVNPANGEYVPEGTPGAWGEYDYIQFLEGIVLPISNEEFKEQIVLRAEQQGRFNV